MNTIKVAILFTVLLFLALTSCNKYEDGPVLSFVSRNERIANTWKMDKALDNGVDVTSSYDRYIVTLTKSGSASLTAHFTLLSLEYDYVTNGTWNFTSNDDKLELNYENDLVDATYVILKLKEKELWLRQENTELELHLAPE
jgi:hypothetical protein